MRRILPRLAPALAACLLLGGSLAAAAQAGLRSGPQPGERPLPFTSNAVTGPNRGKQHCYICEMKDETAVLVFARRLDEPTARLMRAVRDLVRDSPRGEAFGWFVFLAPDKGSSEQALERAAFDFSRQAGCSNLPVTVLGDPQGPPGYLIHPQADLTLLVFRAGKVLHNRTFTAREWNNRAADQVGKQLPTWFRESRTQRSAGG